MVPVSPLEVLRRRALLTQPQLAERIGVTDRTIRKWEGLGFDLRALSVETIGKIASALNATSGQLLGEEPIPGYAAPSTAPDDETVIAERHCPGCFGTRFAADCSDPRHDAAQDPTEEDVA